MLMYRLILILGVAARATGFADTTHEFDLEQNGEYSFAIPKQTSLIVTRDPQNPLPECSVVNEAIQQNLEGIKRCSAGGSRPISYCKLLTADLRRKILGITNEVFNQRAPDAHQTLRVSITAPKVDQNQLIQLAAELGIYSEQLVHPENLSAIIQSIALEASGPSHIELIRGLNDPEMTGATFQRGENGVWQVSTNSRLISCEWLANKSTVQAKARISASFSIPKEVPTMNLLWQIRPQLVALKDWQGTNSMKFLLAGHRFGKFSEEQNLGLQETELLTFAGILIDVTSIEYAITPFENKFQIGSQLPQQKINASTDATAWGKM